MKFFECTAICLDEYAPVKDGYIFDGWYSALWTKEHQVTEVTLNENIVVYAKCIDDGTQKAALEVPVLASTEENPCALAANCAVLPK